MNKLNISLEILDIVINKDRPKILYLEKKITSYSTNKDFSDIYHVKVTNNKINIYDYKGKNIKAEFNLTQFKKMYKEFYNSERNWDPTKLEPINDKRLPDICMDQLKTDNYLFVLDNNYDILGFCKLSILKYDNINFPVINVDELFVDEKERNKGIATYLLEYSEKCITKRHNSKILSISVYNNNIKALNLYKKFGFKEFKR